MIDLNTLLPFNWVIVKQGKTEYKKQVLQKDPETNTVRLKDWPEVSEGELVSWVEAEDIYPIPLNGQMLEDLGFETTEIVHYSKNGLKLQQIGECYIYYSTIPYIPLEVQVYHLHHLQNLYAAEKNDPLPINFDK